MDKFTITPEGISHNEDPLFQASWSSGAAPETPQSHHLSFYYAGSGEEDSILINHIKWENVTFNQEQFNALMDEAITAIDHWISERF